MRLVMMLVGAMLFLMGFAGGCDSHAADKVAIQGVLDKHLRANQAKDGVGIASILSQNTFAHYERIMKIALDGSRKEIQALQASDQLEVMRIRMRAKRKEIEGKSGREYAIFATNAGWYSAPDVPRVELTKFRFAPGVAYARPRDDYDNRALNFEYSFVKEGEEWKYDETTAYEHWSSDMQLVAREERMSMEAFLMHTVSEEAGKKVPNNIFDRGMR